MGKKPLTRKHRTEVLTAEEAARDEVIRAQVRAEFPPLEAPTTSSALRDQLKTAIRDSGKTVRRLAEDANVSLVVLTQFLDGERDLRLATAEKLAQTLGLRLVAA